MTTEFTLRITTDDDQAVYSALEAVVRGLDTATTLTFELSSEAAYTSPTPDAPVINP